MPEFKAAYNRTGTIVIQHGLIEHPERPASGHVAAYPAWTEHFACDICGLEDIPVLAIDSSEDEYGPGRVCLSCINNLFEQEAKLSADDYYTPSPRSTRMQMIAQLTDWANSLNKLNSDRLSEVGIDDSGDLADEVPTYGDWINRFFLMLSAWEAPTTHPFDGYNRIADQIDDINLAIGERLGLTDEEVL